MNSCALREELVNGILSQGPDYWLEEAFIRRVPGRGDRSGHLSLRPSYRANLAQGHTVRLFGMIFDPAGEGQGLTLSTCAAVPAPKALHRLADVLRFRTDLWIRTVPNPAIRSSSEDWPRRSPRLQPAGQRHHPWRLTVDLAGPTELARHVTGSSSRPVVSPGPRQEEAACLRRT